MSTVVDIVTGATSGIGLATAHRLAERGNPVFLVGRDPMRTAAAVDRWTKAGKTVTYFLLTRCDAGIDTMEPAKAGPLPPNTRAVRWDGKTAEGWGSLLDGDTGILHLAGEGIASTDIEIGILGIEPKCLGVGVDGFDILMLLEVFVPASSEIVDTLVLVALFFAVTAAVSLAG